MSVSFIHYLYVQASVPSEWRSPRSGFTFAFYFSLPTLSTILIQTLHERMPISIVKSRLPLINCMRTSTMSIVFHCTPTQLEDLFVYTSALFLCSDQNQEDFLEYIFIPATFHSVSVTEYSRTCSTLEVDLFMSMLLNVDWISTHWPLKKCIRRIK